MYEDPGGVPPSSGDESSLAKQFCKLGWVGDGRGLETVRQGYKQDSFHGSFSQLVSVSRSSCYAWERGSFLKKKLSDLGLITWGASQGMQLPVLGSRNTVPCSP